MGQKVNPIIFRLGVNNKEWNSKYFESNNEEHTLYNYQNIEIQNYLRIFLKKHGIDVHNIKLGYSQKNLYVYISYFYTKKSLSILKNESDHFRLKTTKHLKKRNLKKPDVEQEKLSDFFIPNVKNHRGYKKRNTILKSKRLKIVSLSQNHRPKQKHSTKNVFDKNKFLDQLLETLTIFTNSKYHIKLILQNVNKGLTVNLKESHKDQLKKKVLLLKQYSRRKFFKEGLSVIITLMHVKNTAGLFASYVTKQLQLLKIHGAFMIFVKRTLTYLITLKFSNVQGIKIIVSGRFNGAPRSRSRTIEIGDVPVQSFNKNIDYAQRTAYTKNGTFGVKVWVS